MTLMDLLTHLKDRGVTLAVKGSELIIRGKGTSLEPSLLARLRENKDALVHLIHTGAYESPDDALAVPPNLIPPECEHITPAMLPLVELSEEQIARIIQRVPGGAKNIQDIYPLAPLQGNILLHHLMRTEGDPYLRGLYRFDSRERVDEFLRALRAVIDRHDILRTALSWDGLPEPVQVVFRQVVLNVEEIAVAAHRDAAEELLLRVDPQRYRMDIGVAPLLRVAVTYDEMNHCWLLLCLLHHLAGDQATLQVLEEEVHAYLLGKGDLLLEPVPFRSFVAQARLDGSQDKHERFFRELLGDVYEPTVLSGAMGNVSSERKAAAIISGALVGRVRDCARRLGVTTASLFHVAFAQVLARLSGQEDVVFGSVLLGRMQAAEGAGRALGLFINALPVRVKVDETEVAQCIRCTHSLLAQLLRHEHAPLALVQRYSGIPAPNPLFTALLNYRQASRMPQQR